MIEALITTTGAIINRPRTVRIVIADEEAVAVRRRDEDSNDVIQLTIRDLFDAYLAKKGSYIKLDSGEVDSLLFQDWFSTKYIVGKNIQNNIISIQFNRLP